jgi:predicted NUDIX family NTP pyrophosphohydrolase
MLNAAGQHTLRTRLSAGILLYRLTASGPEVLLVHPGGPFWAKKDSGAWSLPKGLVEDGEDLEAAARREFAEETGHAPPGALRPLGRVRQPGGKLVAGFALQGDFDVETLRSNTFALEWPPRSGRRAEFAEVDRAGWFAPDLAREKLLPGQLPLLDALLALLDEPREEGAAPTSREPD